MCKTRTSFLTFDHAAGVIKAAWDAERPSIALAQALQFECALRQVDVIGAWVALDKRNPSRTYNHEQTEMWVNGITWEDIDGDWILNKRISKTGSYLRVDLKLAPLVVEQMQRMYSGRHLSGPIIVSEITRLPYRKDAFREMWRKFARRAGVPSAVFNMDSRSGGITEATDAGSSLEEVRHLAQHKSPAMTARYSRNTLSKTRGTATARIELRGGN